MVPAITGYTEISILPHGSSGGVMVSLLFVSAGASISLPVPDWQGYTVHGIAVLETLSLLLAKFTN